MNKPPARLETAVSGDVLWVTVPSLAAWLESYAQLLDAKKLPSTAVRNAMAELLLTDLRTERL